MDQNETFFNRTLSNLAGVWRDVAHSAARSVGLNGRAPHTANPRSLRALMLTIQDEVRGMSRMVLTGVSLAIIVVLIVGATIFLRTVNRQPISSDVVRVTLGDRSYAIPSELQPELFGVPSSLVGRALIDKRYQKIYIQAPDDPPATVDSFSISRDLLSNFVTGNARFARMEGVDQLAFRRRPNSIEEDEQRLKEERVGAIPEPNGRFLRKPSGGQSFNLYSQNSILFGSSVKAICNPLGSEVICDVSGRISERSGLRIMLELSNHPIPVWPELLRTVEDFVHMLTIRDRDDQQ